MRMIDLTQDIYQGMKVYPGHLKTVVFEHATHEETSQRFEGGFSFQTTGFLLNDNGPTHVDSFSHLDPDPSAQTIDQMSLDLFYGDAVCLDVSAVPAHTDITDEHLDEIEKASSVDVRPGDIVLFHTATWNRYNGQKSYLTEFPGFGESGSEWIQAKGIKTFGVDSPTPDNPISKTYPCHMMCRRTHITHYENLANLDQVVDTRFTFVGFPLKLQGSHGGPTRAVALVEN
ncbi:cyclase family protein [Actinomycetospora sp.]|jgi:kynurenine formamidase|uniref:cyclase family protein n=1 Tax=Actinomycetospora sp. TaxID=1872135 RepID=UPI002F429C3E